MGSDMLGALDQVRVSRVNLQGGPEDAAGLHARPVGVDNAVQHGRQLKLQDRPAGLQHHPHARVLLRRARLGISANVRPPQASVRRLDTRTLLVVAQRIMSLRMMRDNISMEHREHLHAV